MSFLRCLKSIQSNFVFSTKEVTSRILFNSHEHPLLKPYTDFNLNFDQKRFVRFKTVKRRKTHKLSWWQKKTTKNNDSANLTLENKNLLQEEIKKHFSTPLKHIIFENKEWTPSSKRTGLIARKIGVLPAWLKNGKKITTTLLQINDNHVINCQDIEETRIKTIFQNRWRTHNLATIVVGAESGDVTKYTSEYCGLFSKAGVQPKQKLSKFVITEDAMLPPGTPLNVMHFQVGQCVDIFGKTIDYNFEGVVTRWGFKGDGSKHHGATKFHRRPGSIGQSRKNGGPMKGRKMAGHMGSERKTMRALKILRINTKNNLIFVQGQSVPGPIGSWCYIFDTLIETKNFDPANPPPFPTYIKKNDEELPEDIYHPDLFLMDSPTIEYPKVEEVKRRSGAKIAKIRKK